MNKLQALKDLYNTHGCGDYQLKTIEDLRDIHGIKLENIAGYSNLNDINKNMFNIFLLNFFNAHGVQTRLDIEPICVSERKENGLKFLKFEYANGNRMTWLHVVNINCWY